MIYRCVCGYVYVRPRARVFVMFNVSFRVRDDVMWEDLVASYHSTSLRPSNVSGCAVLFARARVYDVCWYLLISFIVYFIGI